MKLRLLLVAPLFLLACGDNATTQEAYATCKGLLERTHTADPDSFDACVACHENCGDECQTEDGFVCPN